MAYVGPNASSMVGKAETKVSHGGHGGLCGNHDSCNVDSGRLTDASVVASLVWSCALGQVPDVHCPDEYLVGRG